MCLICTQKKKLRSHMLWSSFGGDCYTLSKERWFTEDWLVRRSLFCSKAECRVNVSETVLNVSETSFTTESPIDVQKIDSLFSLVLNIRGYFIF